MLVACIVEEMRAKVVGKTSVVDGDTLEFSRPNISRTMNCQKCRTPLKLDSSLQDLNPAAFDLLVG